ncbi:MAG: LPS export ABC transporter permease LptG [Candidatus Binatia bacterium]
MNLRSASRVASLPIGGILDRYLMRNFIRTFAITLLCFAFFRFIVDFFDRIDNLLKAGAPLWTSFRYFLYKIPLLLSPVFGFATLFSTLFSLGSLSRNHELTAMRSSGLSLQRLSLPLLLVSLLISLLTIFWNEGLVPLFTRKSQYIYKVEVKKKQPQSLFGTRGIWMRGKGFFVSADYFDAKKNVLQGAVIYLLNPDFSLKGLIETPRASWNGTRWEASGGTEWILLPDGQISQRTEAVTFLPLSETPEDFKVFAREPEEFSLFDLQKQIEELKGKGIDTTEYEVNLQVKLALPFISPLMVLLAIPFALRQGPRGGIALSFGLTMLIGFGYWVVLAFCVSLGHSGALQPWIAAWFPNLILALVGTYFFSGEEQNSL